MTTTTFTNTFIKLMENPVTGNLIAVVLYLISFGIIAGLSSHPIGIYVLNTIMAFAAIGCIFNNLFFMAMPKETRKEFYMASPWTSVVMCGIFYAIIMGIFLMTSRLNAVLMLPFIAFYVAALYDRLTD